MVIRRASVIVMAAAVVMAACGPQSKLDASAAVTVRSAARLPSGAPATGVAVTLSREAGADELIGGLFLISFTLFTACLVDDPPLLCRRGFRRSVTTEEGGAVEFQLRGRDTIGTFGAATPFALTTRLPAGGDELAGPLATLAFRIQTEAFTLPDLRIWRPAFELVGANRARWDRLPSDGYGKGSGYRLAFEDTTGVPVWAVESDQNQVTFDPRMLEDSRGGVTLAAKRRLTVNALYTSARRPYTATAGAPASRGKPCAFDGVPTAVACPLTDGNLQVVNAAEAKTAKSASIDLGTPRPIGFIVVRGCACTLETSVDGATWSPVTDLKTSDAALVPPRATTARYVQVRSEGSVSQLREISVWEG